MSTRTLSSMHAPGAASAAVRWLVAAMVIPMVTLMVTAAPADAAPMRVRAAAEPGDVTRVVVISVDGLNPEAIKRLGRSKAPTFYRLVDEGATTFNARTAVEMTLTLPNHTGMVTSRRVARARGGHGVVWNDDRLRPRTVQRAAGHKVASVFSSLRAAGLESALFASKGKLKLFGRSWPGAIDKTVVNGDNPHLVRAVKGDLATHWRELTFVHLSLPDVVGHNYGWLSPPYLDAVHQVDGLVGEILDTVTDTPSSVEHTLVVVTSDHGGKGMGHSDERRLADYRIPFMVWGPGVPAGADLYDLNRRRYADPGRRQVRYRAERQPIRNAYVGNLVLDVLGRAAIPRSELNARQNFKVFGP